MQSIITIILLALTIIILLYNSNGSLLKKAFISNFHSPFHPACPRVQCSIWWHQRCFLYSYELWSTTTAATIILVFYYLILLVLCFLAVYLAILWHLDNLVFLYLHGLIEQLWIMLYDYVVFIYLIYSCFLLHDWFIFFND